MVRYYYISIVALLNNKAYIIILNNVYLQPIHKNISCILLSVQDDRVTARFSGLLIICLLKLSFSELSDFLKSYIVLTFHCFKIYCLCVWRSYTFYLLLRAFLIFYLSFIARDCKDFLATYDHFHDSSHFWKWQEITHVCRQQSNTICKLHLQVRGGMPRGR